MITPLLCRRAWRGFLLLVGLLLSLPVRTQAQVWNRAQPVGTDPLQGVAGAAKTATDAAGNTYVLGSFSGSVEVGGTTLTGSYGDIFVAKLNAAGAYQWLVRADGVGSKSGTGIALDASGNVYVTGTFAPGTATFGTTVLTNAGPYTTDAFVAKLDAAGQWQWAVQTTGTNSEQIVALAADAAGTVYVAGSSFGATATATSFGTQTLPAGGTFVAQVSSAGQWQWVRTGGYSHRSLAVDATGNAYVAGYYWGASLSFGSVVLTGSASSSTNAYVAKISPSGQWQWAAGNSSTSNYPSGVQLHAVTVDATGNVYAAGVVGSGYGASLGSVALNGPGSGSGGFLFVAKLSAAGQWQWARQTTATGFEPYATPNALAVDATGALYVGGQLAGAGHVFGSTTLSAVSASTANGYDAFVAKLTAAGQWQWAVRAGGTGEETVNDLALGSGGTISVVGSYSLTDLTLGSTVLGSNRQGNAFVGQLSAAGQWQWASSSTTGGERQVKAVATDAAGNTYVAGSFHGRQTFGSTTLSSNGGDAFVGKLDASGQWLWVVRGGGSSFDQINALTLDAAGNVYVAGEFASADARFGTPLVSNGGRYVGTDLWVAKLSGSGQWQWATSAGGTGDDSAQGIAVDAAGNVSIVGEFRSTLLTLGASSLTNSSPNYPNLLVARLSPSGQWQWGAQAAGPDTETGQGIAVDASGNICITGYSTSPTLTAGSTTLTTTSYFTALVAKLDGSGNWLWTTLQDSGLGLRLKLDAAANIYVAGIYLGTPTIGGVTLPRGDSTNVFVAKLNPGGQWQWGLGAGATGREDLTDLAVDGAGNAYLTGAYLSNRAAFGSGITLYHTGGTYGFVAKATPAGQWQWAQPVPGTGTTALALGAQQLQVAGNFYLPTATFGSSVVTNGTNSFSGTFLAQLTETPLAAGKAQPLAWSATAYPSPGTGPLTVQLQLRQATPVQLTVRDALGRVRWHRACALPAGQPQELAVPEATHWPAGVYLLTIRQGAQQQTLKIIRQ